MVFSHAPPISWIAWQLRRPGYGVCNAINTACFGDRTNLPWLMAAVGLDIATVEHDAYVVCLVLWNKK